MCECLSSLPWSFFHSLLPWARMADSDPLSCYFSNMCKVPPRNLFCLCVFVYSGSQFHMHGTIYRHLTWKHQCVEHCHRRLVVYPSSLTCMQPMSSLSDPCASPLFSRVMLKMGVESQAVGRNRPNGITMPVHHRTQPPLSSG